MKILFIFILFQPLWGDSLQRQIYLPKSIESVWSVGGSFSKRENGSQSESSFLSFSQSKFPVHIHLSGILEKSPTKVESGSQFTEKSHDKLSKFLWGGISYGAFQILMELPSGTNSPGIYAGLQIHPEKKIYLFQSFENSNWQRGIGVVSGDSFRLGLEIQKNISGNEGDYSGTISLGIPWENILGAGCFSKLGEESESSATLVYSKGEHSVSYLVGGESVYEWETPIKKPKVILPVKTNPIDHPLRGVKITFPLTLDELLKRKVDLKNALQIEKASKRGENFDQFLRNLPKDIEKKVLSLQIEKRTSFDGKK